MASSFLNSYILRMSCRGIRIFSIKNYSTILLRDFDSPNKLCKFFPKHCTSSFLEYGPISQFASFVTESKNRRSLENDSNDQKEAISWELSGLKTVNDEVIRSIKDRVIPLGHDVNENNFDAIFIDICRLKRSFSVGKSFFYLLYSKNNCNIATIGKFLRLCYDFPSQCTDSDKNLIIKLYRELLDKYGILDSRTCESVVLGLSITKDWKEAVQILEMSRYTSAPSTKMYSALICAAFSHGEPDISYELLNELVESGKTPPREVYEAWVNSSDLSSSFREVLSFIEKYGISLSEEIVDLFLLLSRDRRSSFNPGAITSIIPSGNCKRCRKQLKPVNLTDEEFCKLRDAFLNPVLIGRNIFLKTKPEEVKSFLSFLERSGPVEVVLDGLNIAYAKESRTSDSLVASETLCHVIDHFRELGKRVAVIGRKHMANWPKKNMKYIRDNSSLFLAENTSSDDPFLLYTAMRSGLGTVFVSRDQMRAHKFLLKAPELDNIFSRWQQLHQYYLQNVSPAGAVSLVNPMPYFRGAQESEPGVWHIPIVSPLDGVPGHLIANRTKWLCLTSN